MGVREREKMINEKGEIKMENIKITNIEEVKEFIKKNEGEDFVGFEPKFNQNKLIMIAWNEEVEIKLNVDFSSFKFLDFFNLIYKPLLIELKQYSTRKNFWIVD